MQQSPDYRSFFRKEAIDAFAKVESSAFAGKSLTENERSALDGDESEAGPPQQD